MGTGMSNILLETGTNEVEILELFIDEGEYKGYYGVNVAKVLEIIPMPSKVMRPPHLKGTFATGIFNHRDKIVPLLDLAEWLGRTKVESAQAKVLITEFNTTVTAFLVSGVTRIHRATWSDIRPLDGYTEGLSDSVTGVIELENKLVFLLDLEKAIGDLNPALALSETHAQGERMGEEFVPIKVLHADDSHTIRSTIKRRLEENGVFVVESVANGDEAWGHLTELKNKSEIDGAPLSGSVDIVLTDIEMQRRWKAVRERMEAEKIDVLIMQSGNQYLGCYVQWFTDFPASHDYAVTVIFPLNDEMTTITHGGTPPGDMGPSPWMMKGVKTRLTANYFSSVYYTGTYDAELVVKVLKERKDKTVGVVNARTLPYTFYDYILKNLPGVKFVDASDLVDEIKAVKSPEEIGFLMKTVELQDAGMAYARTIIKPGKRDFEIIAAVIQKVTELGSEGQLVSGSSGPAGTPVGLSTRHSQNRMIKEGDQFTLMIEVNGPGGIYGEMGRCLFLGDVPAQLLEAQALLKETRDRTIKLLKPGADPKEIWQANNAFLVSKGQMPESRVFCHGQGLSLVERPCVRNDETMKLKANMNITVHPTVFSSTYWLSMWDNWLITETGVSERLHKTPEEILKIG